MGIRTKEEARKYLIDPSGEKLRADITPYVGSDGRVRIGELPNPVRYQLICYTLHHELSTAERNKFSMGLALQHLGFTTMRTFSDAEVLDGFRRVLPEEKARQVYEGML